MVVTDRQVRLLTMTYEKTGVQHPLDAATLDLRSPGKHVCDKKVPRVRGMLAVRLHCPERA